MGKTSKNPVLTHAEQVCIRKGTRLTPLRRLILKIIARSPQPLGAYHILQALRKKHQKLPAPTQIYRILDFLLTQDLIHRIESRNAYTVCSTSQGHRHEGQFFLCGECGRAEEIHDETVNAALAKRAKALNFTHQKLMIEISGLCGNCQ